MVKDTPHPEGCADLYIEPGLVELNNVVIVSHIA